MASGSKQETAPAVAEEERVAQALIASGGNVEKFTAAYTSLGVNTQTFRADEMAENFRIEGVPTIAVDGRYVALVSGATDEAQGLTNILANTDQLIARVRSERAAASQGLSAGSPAKN